MVRSLSRATTTDGVVRLDQAITGRGLPSYAPVISEAPFEFVRGAYNWKDSNTRIMSQGLGNAMLPSGGMTEQIMIGDSTGTGAISGNGTALFDRLRAWPLAMRDQLANSGIPANGTGLIRSVDGTFTDSRNVSVTGTWASSTAYTSASTVGATGTVVPDRSGTMLDIWYLAGTNSVTTVAVDGVTVGTITTGGGTLAWTNFRAAANIIGNFSQIKVTVTTVGTGYFQSGISVWTPNGGLLVHNVSQGGSRVGGTLGTGNWTDLAQLGAVYLDVAGRKRTVTDAASTSGSSTLTSATGAFTSRDVGKPVDHLSPGAGGLMFPPGSYIGAILSGTTATMYTGPSTFNGVITAAGPVLAINTLTAQSINIGRDPSCVHIALGGNDLNAGRTDAAITADITTLRNRFSNSDCILHLQHEWDPAVVSSAREATFQAAMYALADTLDVPLYDWRTRVGSYANGLAAGVYGDSFGHLTPASGGTLGSDLAALLGDGSGRTQTAGAPVFDNDVVNKAYVDGRKAYATPGSLVSNTTEQVVTGLRLPIPAGGLKVGNVLQFVLNCKPGGATTSTVTVKIRIGTLGTTADAAVTQINIPLAASNVARYIEGHTTIQVIGASATHLGVGTENGGNTGTQSAASGTFSSTVGNYATVTVTSGTAQALQIMGGVLEWK